MINPQNSQKLDHDVIRREMDAFKSYKFAELSKNPSLMFNFFFVNNDIFQKINDEDVESLNEELSVYQDKKEKVQYSSLLGIFVVDQVVLRYAAPSFKIARMRPLVNVCKYLLGTIALTSLVMKKDYERLEESYFNQAQKYDFNYNDFSDSIKVLEKIAQKGKLEQFTKTRDNFDKALLKD